MTSLRNSLDWQSFPIDQIKPYAAHSRVHNKRQIEKLKKLIRHFGQVIPIVIDREGVIVDGHAVWQAMRELGAAKSPRSSLPTGQRRKLKPFDLHSIGSPMTLHGRTSGSAKRCRSLSA